MHFSGSFLNIWQTKATLFNTLSLSLSLSPSLAPHFLPFPPWVSTSSDPGFQDRAINGTLPLRTGDMLKQTGFLV